jgi:hypothetical protein
MNAVAERKPRARRLRKTLGPLITAQTTRDQGERCIEVTIDAHGVTLRARGLSRRYRKSWAQLYLLAVEQKAAFRPVIGPKR